METHILRSSNPDEHWVTAKFRNKLPFEVRILGNDRAQSEAVERAICDSSYAIHLTRVSFSLDWLRVQARL